MISLSLEHFDKNLWLKTKQEWRDKINSLDMPEDIEGQMVIQIEYRLDRLYNEASYYYSHYKILYENLNDTMDALRKAYGDEGNNPEERRAKAYSKLLYYPSGNEDDEETKNLIEIRNTVRKRYYFFRDYVMDNLKTKSDRLRTNIGASKIEAQILSSYGAGA